MNNMEREIKNSDGSIETVMIVSDDDYKIDMKGSYKLANYRCEKENKFMSKFKNSILGSEIGIKAEGFSNIAILATIVAVGAFSAMYILFRV